MVRPTFSRNAAPEEGAAGGSGAFRKGGSPALADEARDSTHSGDYKCRATARPNLRGHGPVARCILVNDMAVDSCE